MLNIIVNVKTHLFIKKINVKHLVDKIMYMILLQTLVIINNTVVLVILTQKPYNVMLDILNYKV